MRSHDTLHGSNEDDDSNSSSGLSAQALHGSVLRYMTTGSSEHVAPAPPSFREERAISLPSGTLFDREQMLGDDSRETDKPKKVEGSAEDDEDDDEEDDETTTVVDHDDKPVARRPVAPAQPREEHRPAEWQLLDTPTQTPANLPPLPQLEQFRIGHPSEGPTDATAELSATDTLEPSPIYEYLENTSTTASQEHVEPSHAGSEGAPTQPLFEQPTHQAQEASQTPPAQTGPGGGQPPIPPINRPPHGPQFNAMPDPGGQGPSAHFNAVPLVPNPNTMPMPPFNPNMAPGPQFNQAPVAPTPPAELFPVYKPNRAANMLLGLGVVGTFLQGRHNRKMIKEVAGKQQEMATNFADIKAQQVRAGQEQHVQSQELQDLRVQQEQMRQPAVARTAEQMPLTAPAPRQEAMPLIAAPATPFNQAPNRPQTAERPPQQNAEAQTLTPTDELEPVQLKPKERVEHSTWHSIVVNERGREVEGAMSYGEGFQRERRQEAIRDPLGDASAAGIAAMGAMHQQQSGQNGYYGSLPSGMTNPTLPQGPASHADSQHQLPAKTKSGAPAPIFWIMLAVIIAAFLAAAFI